MKKRNKYWVIAFIIGILWFIYWDPSYWSNNGYNLSSDPGRPGELSLTNSNYHVLAEFVSKIGGNEDYIIVESKDEKKLNIGLLNKKQRITKEKVLSI